MKLYKYGRSEHNPLRGCEKLQLGTTMAFSKNDKGEGDLINDKDEGLTYGSFGHSFQFIACDMCPGGYVFSTCGEKLDADAVHRDFSKDYDDCYSIVNVDEFHKTLGRLVLESLDSTNVNLNSLCGRSTHDNRKIGINRHGVACNAFFQEISYDKSPDLLGGTATEPDSMILLTHFTKPKKHEYQKEYRFFYVPLTPDGIYLELKSDEPLLVDARPLLNFFTHC